MKVAIIGAGIAGLASARRAAQYNLEFSVFEQTGNVGGIWAYTENGFTDEFNNPVHSSIFASTRLLTPVQLMEYDGFEFKPKSGSSYPGHKELLQYLQEFANKYDLLRYIKFYHQVKNVSKNSTGWKITIKDLKNNLITDHIFDAIMLCNGRYTKPVLPIIEGLETFLGDEIHSHNYRRKDPFKDKCLLLIGAGTSAIEIGIDCSQIAKQVYLSYRSNPPRANIGEKIIIKPQISHIKGNEVYFNDRTKAFIDSIIHCTGYKYDCSILDSTCGLEIVDDFILKPLYKMFINANHPSMCIIGLPQRVIVPTMDDLQAELFVKHLASIIKLPLEGDMLKSFEEEYSKKLKNNKVEEYYNLGLDIRQYFEELCMLGKLKVPPIYKYKLREYSRQHRKNNYLTFRNQKISITDEENFICD